MYGTHRRRLEAKINHARRKVKEIQDVLEEIGDADTPNRDVALIQFFVLEQFNAFKRYALKYQFFFFPASTPRKIHPILWILGWMFMFAALLFFAYWVLAWGIGNGTAAFKSWGINFTLQFAEDVALIQVIKVYVLYVLAMYSIRPQLNFIYSTLNKLAVCYAQDGSTESALHDIRVVQHMSPACRAARLQMADGLASAKILRQVDDIDLEVCQKSSHFRLMLLAIFLLWIPAAVSLVSVMMGELVLASTVPAVFSAFVIANYFMYSVSLVALIIIYVAVIWFYIWKATIASSTLTRINKNAKSDMTKELHLNRELRMKHLSAKRKAKKSYVFMFVKYVYNFFTNIIIHLMLLAYYPRHISREKAREKARLALIWKNMNMPWMSPEQYLTNTPIKKAAKHSIHQMLYGGQHWDTRTPVAHDRIPVLSSDSASQQAETSQLLKRIPFNVRDTLKGKPADWKKTAAMPKHRPEDYFTVLLNEVLLNSKPVPPSADAVAVSLIQAEQEEKYRRPHVRPILYRDKHMTTMDPSNALLRMLQKHVGNVHMISTVHSQADEYFSMITDYEQFDKSVHCDVLTDIIKDIFTVYRPGGYKLNEEELNEVMEQYYSWMLDHDLDRTMVPFPLFEAWFFGLSQRIVFCKSGESGFEVLSETEDSTERKIEISGACVSQ